MENVSYLCSVTDEVTKHRQLDARISRRMLVPYTESSGFLLIHMDEIWKPVLGYEGLYEVSNLGEIVSLSRMVPNSCGIGVRRSPGRYLKQRIDSTGYYAVSLCKNGKPKTKRVHDLVCSAFHGPKPSGMEVLHMDGTRTNNRADNLMWGTRKENMNDRLCKERMSNATKRLWLQGRLNSIKKRVIQYDILGRKVAEYESINAASRATGLMRESISHACNGASKTAGGYIWKFKEV